VSKHNNKCYPLIKVFYDSPFLIVVVQKRPEHNGFKKTTSFVFCTSLDSASIPQKYDKFLLHRLYELTILTLNNVENHTVVKHC
jgi:hypothetical protein